MIDLIPYLQMPYLHRGRTWQGSDCFGLLRLYFEKELGILLDDYTKDYAEDWWKDKNLFLQLYKTYGFVPVDCVKPHSVLMFYNSSKVPGHVGIAFDDAHFVHMTDHGGGVGNYLYGSWARRLHSVYCYKDLIQ